MVYWCVKLGLTNSFKKLYLMANISQLVRVLDCGSKSHGFKSHFSPNFIEF
jgi:hypothetical protein